jgi:hypothetical protein
MRDLSAELEVLRVLVAGVEDNKHITEAGEQSAQEVLKATGVILEHP